MVPLGFAVVYGIDFLCGRVCKKNHLSKQDQHVDNTAKKTLGIKDSPNVKMNKELAKNIIKNARTFYGNDNEDVIQMVKSKGFLEDPVLHAVKLMIERSVGRARSDDSSRSFLISQIPHFVDKLGSIDFLKLIAKELYKDKKIIAVLNKSFNDPKFKADLKKGTDKLRDLIQKKKYAAIYYVENELRIVLNVFNLAKNLEHYHIPMAAYNESFLVV